jgi:lipopolysaccharide transport system ATP-binding protein
MIRDRLGQPVFGTNTHHLRRTLHDIRAGEEYEFKFRFRAALGPGGYSISTALHRADTHLGHNYQWRDHALAFNVANLSQLNFVGQAWLPVEVGVERRLPVAAETHV